ncbi:alpha/beta hydrolase [Streptomyces sp. NBC_01020]|uniref:RBBP9/YdeN family alpha/beta hydrolase n=1 Tax=Streptomyces sp. NBC_01020 TaxID=2903722 RepID=UPI00386B9564|nr:alpha/beta hydrolase [Streptomyces sp. NBC_01020]
MSTVAPPPAVLIVPGLRDHVPEHWQTVLGNKLPGARTVAPVTTDRLSCDVQVAALDEALSEISGPVVLVAHSVGVITVAHWAQRHTRPIQGALLATPPDLETPMPEGHPSRDDLGVNGWLPVPRAPLPFPSIVAASTDDPLAGFAPVAALARAWGSRLVDLGPVGHLNPAAGYGEWPQAEQYVRELSGEGR